MSGDPSRNGVSGIGNVYWFAIFNALSYQIVLGTPMILFTKSLGAGATVLGVVAGMMPLLVIFQIPAANYVVRVGYRRFQVAGWSVRVLFILLMALVPLTSGFLRPMGQLSLLLLLLFGFNLSRGISSAAWLPWLTSLVPEDQRGRYLLRESACVNSASVVTLLLAALVLQYRPASWQFAVIFAFSGVMGAISLSFLKRIPDVPPAEGVRSGGEPVPWLAMARHAPFRKLLRMNIAWAFSYGGMTVFTVAYLKVFGGVSSGWILVATAAFYLGGLGALAVIGPRLDRHGSRPVLILFLTGWLVIALAWTLLSGGVWGLRIGWVVAMHAVMGLGFAVYSMANTRLAMSVVPVMGRSHFFALFSVVGNLSIGLAPILWGVVIDAWGDRVWQIGGWELNRYSLFFGLASVGFGLTWMLSVRLEEPQSGRVERLLQDLLRAMPVPSWVRIWPRG